MIAISDIAKIVPFIKDVLNLPEIKKENIELKKKVKRLEASNKRMTKLLK